MYATQLGKYKYNNFNERTFLRQHYFKKESTQNRLVF